MKGMQLLYGLGVRHFHIQGKGLHVEPELTVCTPAPCLTRCPAGKYMASAFTASLDIGREPMRGAVRAGTAPVRPATTTCSGLRSFDEVLAACVDCNSPHGRTLPDSS